mmetsp:Transcript_26526/g.39237  ORF Transcript_26526/g.39237 Transcript_26526/m.39237 type:complete len:261 (+) Transcript_26526:208-990(+)|eukprot:CAMPEP_0194210158 /NCGR_PEP_ID=MMETSP0156-20130528/8053_1 /TAXON_ID=33649 /ORGANISM="Thalassionema nitzschioides, Strain L26-B" /LENGTH=260 /DNA_ID=CAMNT_0038937471 /DNA_START=187 /DNA_END=969 /DNA_ORIENTATION=+
MSTEEKKKKSKLEKIYELKATSKGLKEENRILRKQLKDFKLGKTNGGPSEEESVSSANESKLMEAMKALKRVTMKQEMLVNTVRTKSEQRRKQVLERDGSIRRLQQEVVSLKLAASASRSADTDDDVISLRNKIGDLEIRCADQENLNRILTNQVQIGEEKIINLERQVESARALVGRGSSNKSIDSSSSEFDLARMKKELASKIEQIVLLEFDLEMCKEELHELKENRPFPDQDMKPNYINSYTEDFYSDEDDEESWED